MVGLSHCVSQYIGTYYWTYTNVPLVIYDDLYFGYFSEFKIAVWLRCLIKLSSTLFDKGANELTDNICPI